MTSTTYLKTMRAHDKGVTLIFRMKLKKAWERIPYLYPQTSHTAHIWAVRGASVKTVCRTYEWLSRKKKGIEGFLRYLSTAKVTTLSSPGFDESWGVDPNAWQIGHSLLFWLALQFEKWWTSAVLRKSFAMPVSRMKAATISFQSRGDPVWLRSRTIDSGFEKDYDLLPLRRSMKLRTDWNRLESLERQRRGQKRMVVAAANDALEQRKQPGIILSNEASANSSFCPVCCWVTWVFQTP